MYYTPIAFNEKVTFWLQPPGHCLVRVRLLHRMRVHAWLYASLRTNNAPYAHSQGSDPTSWSQKVTLLSESKAIKV